MDKKEFFTRKDYMKGLCTHREFYSQFVTDYVKDIVLFRVGKERIEQSTDEHLNDIPLKEWDALSHMIRDTEKDLWKRATNTADMNPRIFVWALSDGVCIAKEAAQQIREDARL